MNPLYHENVTSRWVSLILWTPAIILTGVTLYQIYIEPIGNNPASTWLLGLLSLLMIAIALNFNNLKIQVFGDCIEIRYGIVKRRIPLSEITDCYLDDASAFRYGGWGIRMGYVNGKRRLVFNTISPPRVVLTLRKGTFNEFVFSTNNPDTVLNTLKPMIQK